jgi:secondary thiamine-phosphate synthase enzyme
MHVINIKTSDHSQLLDITSEVEKLIPPDFTDGICHIFSLHTTAALTVNENADPSVQSDMLEGLERIVPWSHAAYRHLEGNSSAHIKASMMGFSQTLPIVNGKLALGTWQGLYFCEFDGPRNRSVHVQFFKELHPHN